MTKSPPSPWVDRFRDYQTADISELLSNVPPKQNRRNHDSDADYLEALKLSFENLFIPTAQVIQHAKQLIAICSSHAVIAYRDGRDFLRQSYAKNGPDPRGEIFPICFTGPAGIGKTSLLKRMIKVFPPATSICIDSGHRAFPLNAIWYLSIEDMTSITQMLKTLILNNGGEPSDNSITGLLRQCRRLAYQSGVCLLVLDELQALTQSSTANARITKMLLEFRRIGIPIVYGANYSLVHRLRLRPPEDVERLLSAPIILLPDNANSTDWERTVKGFVDVDPDLIRINASSDAATIHTWTAGSKRLLSFLLRNAAKSALRRSKSLGLNEIQEAYESTEFSINRKNVEIMNLQYVTGKKERADLWCPFDLPPSEKATLKQATADMNMQQMTEEMIYGSMSQGQKQLYQDLLKAASGERDSKVVAIGRNASPSIEDFERGEAILKDLE